ncbi:hypothetical protein IFM89_013999 [Coptis chinensis]|uniref:Uncharacterized protein n=1 Tax=Coptis chinensis TaxID=261450 RepID=A0A835INY8_9MAGN|nr:hypothetical protein IFM89_013999 [Coptis chinensis]
MEPRRVPLKAHNSNWKEKLRDNCFKRIREDRNKLLWKMRAPSQPSHKEVMELTFRDIVTDELKRIKDSSFPVFVDDDVLWEYDGLQKTEGECEEILIEMQRIFYKDLRTEETTRALAGKMEYDGTWEEDDDDYLVKAALEQLQLSNDQA